jgi:secreted trypsin-like serine protease
MRRDLIKPVAVVLALVCVSSVAAGTAVAGSGGGKARASIVGGGPADFSRWPFTVALFRSGRFSCGGSVIAPTKVLTAAHCIERIAPTKLSVVANRPQITARGTGETIGVVAAVAHPDYEETRRHDMAVLTLAAPTTAPPVTLANVDENNVATAVGALLRVAGWGAKNPFGFKLARYIKETTEKVRTTRRCRRVYGKFVFSPESMICALGSKLTRFKPLPIHTSACSGDSGGPLVADLPSGPRQVGIVSYGGSLCGLPGAPTVYTRVSAGLDFIATQNPPPAP